MVFAVLNCTGNSSDTTRDGGGDGTDSPSDADADADTDSDADADTDSDADADTDSDTDADADSDTDTDTDTDSTPKRDSDTGEGCPAPAICSPHCQSVGGTVVDGSCDPGFKCCDFSGTDGDTDTDGDVDTDTDTDTDADTGLIQEEDTFVDPEVWGELIEVDPSTQYQTFEGWGVSICWWGNQIGRWSKENMNDLVEYVVNPVDGLGYTVFRFNIGGGENPSHNHMTQFRDMPGYQPSEGVWDWDADQYQRQVLQRILARGEDLGRHIILEAFSNSPPYWMTNSGCASGASSSGNNLPKANYGLFADYLTEVVKYYRDTYDIIFDTLNPLNEPDSDWWTEGNTQEGCTFWSNTQSALLEVVGASLVEKGLYDTTLSAPDENSINTTIESVGMYSETALSYMSQINTHSYNGNQRNQLRGLADSLNMKLWQSESGPLGWSGSENAVAIYMADRIVKDLREMQPVAWLDWQVVDGGIWGSIHVNQNQQTFSFTKRFYMHRNFSNFIDQDSVFVDVDHEKMVAAVSKSEDALTIVALNTDTVGGQEYTFDLSAFFGIGDAASVYRTSTTEDLAKQTDIAIYGKRFHTTIPAYSITTFVIPINGG